MNRVKSITAMRGGDGDSGRSDVDAAAVVAIAGRKRKQGGEGVGECACVWYASCGPWEMRLMSVG